MPKKNGEIAPKNGKTEASLLMVMVVIMAKTLGPLAVDGLMRAAGANALNYVSDVLHLEPLRNFDQRNVFGLEADGSAAHRARKVYVTVLIDAVFLLAAAVVERVQQILLDKEGERAEQSAAVHGRE